MRLAVAAAVTVLVLGLAVFAGARLLGGSSEKAATAQEQAQANADALDTLAQVRAERTRASQDTFLALCREIESVKTALRAAVRRNQRLRESNLDLKLSDADLARARESDAQNLRRYAARSCTDPERLPAQTPFGQTPPKAGGDD